MFVATGPRLALISLGTRRRDVVARRRDERRTAPYPVNEIALARAALASRAQQRAMGTRKKERENGGIGGWGHTGVSTERGLSHVPRHISNFTVRSLSFSPTTSFASSFSPRPPPPSSSSRDYFFPYLPVSSRSRLSLSFAIRQSSCQIKFHGERSPRTRGVHVTAETIRRWMLRNFRIGKTREMYCSPLSSPPRRYFSFLGCYIFYSRGRCLLRLCDFLRSS